jgi:hypothetical protein
MRASQRADAGGQKLRLIPADAPVTTTTGHPGEMTCA